MNNYYFTFGQNHTHRVNGFTYDCDVVCLIKADDEGMARKIAFEVFGPKFCTSYPEGKLDMSMFPRRVKELEL